MGFDLDSHIDARIEAKLRELGLTSAPTGSYDAQHLPPGFLSAESFAWKCRKLGLDRALYKQGRAWVVPKSVWDEARREDKARRRGPAPAQVDPIDVSLERAGLRLVRGRRP
jgi:hypothetical protein